MTCTQNGETVLAYHFTAGRYHATPWGAHVNEGLVEWPPSPYRILRALTATGFSRLGWEDLSGAARELMSTLGAADVSYVLPSATSSHTRHYMPPFKGNTTKVIDAFLKFPTDSTLFVKFDTALLPSARALLAELLRAQPYLGRAEAWIDAELLESTPDGLDWLIPQESAHGSGFERIEVLALEQYTRYAEWRTKAIQREVERKEEENKARAEAKQKAAKPLSKKDLDKIGGSLPAHPVEALLLDTASLRADGWSQPPGTRWVSYFRCLGATSPRIGSSSNRSAAKPVAALLALSSDTKNAEVFPQMKNALVRMEVLHDALVAESSSGGTPSPCFTGKIDGALTQHQHASLHPLTLGKRAERIDHVLVYCPMGFDADARRALSSVRKTYAKNLPELYVTLAGVGTIEAFATELPVLMPSTTFVSCTPFVPARFLKRNGADSLLGQVERELNQRGFPKPSAVKVKVASSRYIDAASVVIGKRATDLRLQDGDEFLAPSSEFRHYVRSRTSRPAPISIGLSLLLEFSLPVRGPLAIGYGSHFGIGMFKPASVS